MESINTEKVYTNNQVAELLGCDVGYIRKLKSQHNEVLKGMWSKDGVTTVWSEAGLQKLSEWVKTGQALALRESRLVETDSDIAMHENQIKSQSRANVLDRYADLPSFLGAAITSRLLDENILGKTDAVVVQNVTYELANGKADLAKTVDQVFDLMNI